VHEFVELVQISSLKKQVDTPEMGCCGMGDGDGSGDCGGWTSLLHRDVDAEDVSKAILMFDLDKALLRTARVVRAASWYCSLERP